MKRIIALSLALTLALSLTVNAASFTDIEGHWAKDSINYVVSKGLFNGTSTTTFSPETTMSRAMLVTVLHRYAGSPAVTKACRFTDVPSNEYYANAMAWAQSKSIIPWWMCDKPTIRPNDGVSRAEFASMMFYFYLYLGGKHYGNCDADFKALYPDLLAKGQAENWETLNMNLAWAYSYGILNGTTATTMSPLTTVTRAQVSTILQRFDSTFLKSGSFKDCNPTVKAPTSTTQPVTEQPEQTPDNKYGIDYGYVQTADEKAVEEELIQLINDYRKENGLEPLVKSEVLMECADLRAQEIKIKFAHTRPDGTDSSTIVKEVTGLNYGCSENIGRGQFNAKEIFNAWKNSPGHNNLMLNEIGKSIGVGFVRGGYYWIMNVSFVDIDTLYYNK